MHILAVRIILGAMNMDYITAFDKLIKS